MLVVINYVVLIFVQTCVPCNMGPDDDVHLTRHTSACYCRYVTFYDKSNDQEEPGWLNELGSWIT